MIQLHVFMKLCEDEQLETNNLCASSWDWIVQRNPISKSKGKQFGIKSDSRSRLLQKLTWNPSKCQRGIGVCKRALETILELQKCSLVIESFDNNCKQNKNHDSSKKWIIWRQAENLCVSTVKSLPRLVAQIAVACICPLSSASPVESLLMVSNQYEITKLTQLKMVTTEATKKTPPRKNCCSSSWWW